MNTRLLFIALTFVSMGFSHSESLGTYGQTYIIKERDAIETMKDAVRQKLANGGKEQMIKGAQDRYMASLENVVTPVGIKAAKSNAVRFVDLTEIVKTDIKDEKGSVVVAAGFKINPLAIKPLTKKIFFIDAKDDRQIKLVQARALPQDKVILLGGSVFSAGKVLKRRIYLDVPGLHTKMQIHSIPSIASQEGVLLKVEEVAL